MYFTHYIIEIIIIYVSGAFCCSDFKDNGIGRVAQDFNDIIQTITVNSPVDCSKYCDNTPTCMSFEYAAVGSGVNVTCTLKELPVVMDYFYTDKSNHRYYRKSKLQYPFI